MHDIAKKFGNKLRAKRTELGITQEQLALMSDIDQSYVGRIERGTVNITLEKAYRLSEILQCDIRDLLP
ncbi:MULTISPECIES: helix-turn-helix domain-containing protein [Aeromonas]|uniref:helix-turn-helix domain-containing protein n=1 Tax=Aeromonas TaxID=642 RepID=UPI0015F8CD9E|nr:MULTISPECIES: helix-turn-helix transcriptional regulator [Aeromonas]MBL0539720.1 helix-turn-helix transcriptional regulator [Aeromonas caviae]MBP4060256.1 helix-turn-helix transcriptional regulator [Aeromonas sp. Prich7-2]UXB11886.1 helix-turn-helix transcriptional regulator [Aeromonas dhakensis]